MVFCNAQLFEPRKFSKDFNRPGELVAGHTSAYNGRLVCVESDGVVYVQCMCVCRCDCVLVPVLLCT